MCSEWGYCGWCEVNTFGGACASFVQASLRPIGLVLVAFLLCTGISWDCQACLVQLVLQPAS